MGLESLCRKEARTPRRACWDQLTASGLSQGVPRQEQEPGRLAKDRLISTNGRLHHKLIHLITVKAFLKPNLGWDKLAAEIFMVSIILEGGKAAPLVLNFLWLVQGPLNPSCTVGILGYGGYRRNDHRSDLLGCRKYSKRTVNRKACVSAMKPRELQFGALWVFSNALVIDFE